MLVVVPHTPMHDIRTPLYRSFGRKVEDIIVVYDKAILDLKDYRILRGRAEQIFSKLNDRNIALLLTGSYAACIIVYDVMRELGFEPRLLLYDSHLRRYFEVSV